MFFTFLFSRCAAGAALPRRTIFLVSKKRLLKFPHLRIFFDFFLLDLANQRDSAFAWLRHLEEHEKIFRKVLRSFSLNRSPSRVTAKNAVCCRVCFWAQISLWECTTCVRKTGLVRKKGSNTFSSKKIQKPDKKGEKKNATSGGNRTHANKVD